MLAALAVANAVKPIANAESPVPASTSPAPIPKIAAPIKAIAPLKPRMAGTNGARTNPATPIIAKAPARAISPLAIDSQLIAPRTERAGVRTRMAAAATSKAAEPERVPFMAFKPMARIVTAPPRVTRPFAISSQVKEPIFSIAVAMTTNAVATAIKPTPTETMFLGMNLTAVIVTVNAPAMATRPRAISSHRIPEKSSQAEANIFIAAPMAIKAIPVDTTFLAFPVSLVNSVISVRRIAIELRPFPISSHRISEKSLQAEARTLMAADKMTIPVAVMTVLPLNLAVLMNRETSANKTPTPTNPLAS